MGTREQLDFKAKLTPHPKQPHPGPFWYSQFQCDWEDDVFVTKEKRGGLLKFESLFDCHGICLEIVVDQLGLEIFEDGWFLIYLRPELLLKPLDYVAPRFP